MSISKYAYYSFSIAELVFGIRNWPTAMRLFLQRQPSRSATIQLRRSNIRLRVRGAMDVWIAKETFLDRFYERYGTPVQDGWTVVDVGAGIGDFPIYVGHNHPSTRVYAFEPFPESFALLQQNLQLNRITNVQAFPEAIGAESGTLSLDLSSGEPLQFSTGSATQPEKTLSVPCLSLADAFQRLALDRCDLLKLDCEGAEYDILFSTSDATLHQIGQIVMEYHEGVTKYGARDLVQYLTGKGFQVRTHPNPVHGHLGFLHASRAGS